MVFEIRETPSFYWQTFGGAYTTVGVSGRVDEQGSIVEQFLGQQTHLETKLQDLGCCN
jgi:hypothetical protein